ncbi:MAG: hypothetical protein GY861_22515 [bacterium]|nr:hypothetical protein [bacterium]
MIIAGMNKRLQNILKKYPDNAIIKEIVRSDKDNPGKAFVTLGYVAWRPAELTNDEEVEAWVKEERRVVFTITSLPSEEDYEKEFKETGTIEIDYGSVGL